MNALALSCRTSSAVYRWRPGQDSRWTGDAQVIGEHLEALLEGADGRLTPDVVVEDARDKNSPLHPNFEWDDKRAATEHRRETARRLIGSLVVVEIAAKPVEVPTRAFVSVQADAKRFFTTVVTAMQEPVMRDQVLHQAWQDLQAWRKKYAGLKEFAAIISAIDEIGALLPVEVAQSAK